MSDKVSPIRPNMPQGFDKGGGSGDDGDMEGRIRTLEDAVLKINTILPNLASKEDLHRTETAIYKAINEQTWKFVGWTTGIGAMLVAVAFFIARNVK